MQKTIIALVLWLSLVSQAGAITLNYEALRARGFVEHQLNVMSSIREALLLMNTLLPLRLEAVSKNSGRFDISPEKFYKEMLSKKTSSEVFYLVLNFLREDVNNGAAEFLSSVFQQAGSEFHVRWLWLYPTEHGLMKVVQEDMTSEVSDKIWNSQMLLPIYEISYESSYFSRFSRKEADADKWISKILRTFPSSRIVDMEGGRVSNSKKLVQLVLPDSSGIPNIIRKSFEMMK